MNKKTVTAVDRFNALYGVAINHKYFKEESEQFFETLREALEDVINEVKNNNTEEKSHDQWLDEYFAPTSPHRNTLGWMLINEFHPNNHNDDGSDDEGKPFTEVKWVDQKRKVYTNNTCKKTGLIQDVLKDFGLK